MNEIPTPLISNRMMHCLLVGGLNAGRRLDVRADAKFIELKTLSHLKPIIKAGDDPEKVYIKDIYEIHPFQIVDTGAPDKPTVICIGVTAGKELTWAFGEMVRAYCEEVETRRKQGDENIQTEDIRDQKS